MAYTFILAGTAAEKQIALIRNQIDDVAASENPTAGTDYFLSDERIAAFVQDAVDEAPTDANDAEKRLMAAAAAEGALAKNQAFVLKKARTLGREDDGPAVGAEIRAHSASLLKRAWQSINDRRALADKTAAEVDRLAAKVGEPQAGGFAVETRF